MGIAILRTPDMHKRMNWQAISFDWNQVRAFLATAEEGSLSAAARATGATQPTLGRQVAALEQALGVTLFERTGRSLVMTGAGQDLLEHVQAMGAAASRISMVASGQSQDIAGTVSITASDLFSAKFLPDMIAALRKEAPGIDVHIVASNRIENLTKRDADIAIRHVRPDQPDLIARHVADFSANLFAATSYLEARGRPSDPAGLAGHDFLGTDQTARLTEMMAEFGLPVQPEQFRVATDSGTTMWELLQAGLGMAVMPDRLGDSTAGVERVLLDHPPIKFPVWLATHRELRTSKRIRIVFDFLADGLRAQR